MLDRAQLERVVRQLALDRSTPRIDLGAPIRLGVVGNELIGSEPALEIDPSTPESRESGSDLAIGHAAIVGTRVTPASPPKYHGSRVARVNPQTQSLSDGRILDAHTSEETDR